MIHAQLRFTANIPHRLLALQPQGVEHHQQTYWQVQTLLPSVFRFSKFHRFTTLEERGIQDEGTRVHKVRQQGGVQPMERPNT